MSSSFHIKRPRKYRHVWKIFAGILVIIFIWFLYIFAPFLGFLSHPFRLLAGDKTYLIIFQNNYELRPTGGFVSSFALLNTKGGFPTALNFEDVYGTIDDHPFVTPPEPMGKLLAHPTYQGYTFRDANFSPDFPTSARQLIDFMHRTRPNQRVDGVFALDVSFLEDWLTVMGPVKVGDEVFESEHFLEQMEQQVSDVDLHDLNALANRKGGLRELAQALMKKSLRPWNISDMVRLIEKNFEEKHLLAYFADEKLEDVVLEKQWGGVLEVKPVSEFLAVVDANFGGGKSNRYVSRSVFYNIDLEAGKASLDVRYDHPNSYSLPLSTDYRGYVRAYVPLNHDVGEAEYKGKEGSVFFAGNDYTVPVQTSKDVHFDFTFPPHEFETPEYLLKLWKQPGTERDFYHVTVRVPTGMRIASRDFVPRENIAAFEGFLETDRLLAFEIERDPYPPRPILQELSSLNALEIQWNEPIEGASLSPSDWKITDLNSKNPLRDEVMIENAELDGNRLIIKTVGMTEQPEEVYILEISGVRDRHGNALPKRSYTFYQRLVE